MSPISGQFATIMYRMTVLCIQMIEEREIRAVCGWGDRNIDVVAVS